METKLWEKIIKDLTLEEIIKIVTELGSGYPKTDSEGNYIFQSICHGSDSWKLYFYPENKTFFCFRDWEKFNIFSLIMKVKDIDFSGAYRFVCDLLGKSPNSSVERNGFGSNYVKSDWDIFDKFSRIEDKIISEEKEFTQYNPNILNLYSDVYYEGWIKEHISIPAMQKYGIKYDIASNRIIIPHYDKNDNLIGIRCRNLDQNAEAKYCPITLEGKLYSHSLSNNLYGLNHNFNTIKNLRKVMIIESEKSVLQAETYFPDHSFVVACCGSNISQKQIELLLEMGITEVILAMDWDFMYRNSCEVSNDLILKAETEEYKAFKRKILKLSKKLIPYFSVEVLLPTTEPYIYKCSPTDLGKDYLIKSMKNKLYVTYDIIENELEAQINDTKR